ncbi:MAG TPA: hypothetical protein VFP41_11370 [Actinomycetota bacterium]|nr:hypothetical protein [Actinomycetota bacterium]
MDARSLDFWLGNWDCTWSGGHGTNSVARELDGRVVVERFEARGPGSFRGISLSVFDEEMGWRQTWADSNGGYWHLVGSALPDRSLIFATPGPVDAERVFKRMVFSDIERDRFHWRWESSLDGERWQERWAIDYTRRA